MIETMHETETEPTNRISENPGVAAMSDIRWRIPGDQVAKAVADFSDSARETLKWLAGYCRRENLSPAAIGAKLKNKSGQPYSGDAISAIYHGRRQESELGHLLAEVKSFRRTVEEREGLIETGFIEWSGSKQIWDTCQRAFLRRRITYIFGESQVGKTTALIEYQRRHNHGETIYVRMPTGGAMGNFLQELALSLGIPPAQRQRELRQRIMESFDDRMLLIVDECHQCIPTHVATRSLLCLDFCREINERRKCGIVLCGTNVFRDGMLRGSHAKVLRQLWLRGYSPLQLPAVPNEQARAVFAKAFGLDPATDKSITFQYEGEKEAQRGNPISTEALVCQEYGLGRWISILQDASDEAQQVGKGLTWGRVLAAHARFRKIEQSLHS